MDSRQSIAVTADSDAETVPLVLVVEDDEDNQLLLKHAIGLFGWRYTFAVDAVNAIAIAKTQSPNVILLDIILPQINGLQIAAMLKSHRQTCDIPLIAVTGLARKKEQNLILAAGFDDYICKPYILDELQQAISFNLSHKLYCSLNESES